ncbi:MAG: hypothetical protein QMD09_05565 [Desulfatibacillaceae bacterium]|nr:hypothetical protein [Desulfatibacillaceae bacterium]
MLTIPLEQNRVQIIGPSAPTAPSLPQNPFASVRVTAAGEETGFALMGLGSQTRRLSRDLLILAARAEERKDALIVNEKIDTLSQSSLDLEKTLHEHFRGGLAIDNVTRQGLSQFDAMAQELSGQLEKPRQKELFTRQAKNMRLLFARDLARYEAGQQALHEETVIASTRSGHLEKARLLGQSSDADGFEKLLPIFDETIARQFAGLVPDAAQREFEALARRHFLESMSLADPQQAARLLDMPAIAGRGWDEMRESLGGKPLLWRHIVDNLTVQGIENLAKDDRLKQEAAANAKAKELEHKLRLGLENVAITGRYSEESRQAVDELAALGGNHAENAKAWKSRFSHGMEIWSNLADSQQLSFAERFERLEKLMPGEDDPHFEDKSAAYFATALRLEADFAVFQNDPAGYAQRLLEENQDAEAFAALPLANRVEQIVELQKTLGRKEPLVLSTGYKEFFWDNFNSGDAQARSQLLNDLKAYGQYQHQACQELALPPTYSLAATVDRYLAKSIVAAYDAAVKGSGRRAYELAHESWPAAPAFWYPNKMGGILSLLAQKTRNAQYTVMANDFYRAFVELTLQTGDYQRAENVMFQHLELVNRQDILLGWIPQKEINRTSDSIVEVLKQRREFAAKTIASQPSRGEEAESLRKNGFFVPSARGDSFLLIHPDSGTAFSLPGDDKPFEVTLKYLESIIPAKGNERFVTAPAP